MFETMQGFLFFFIPMCIAIILGILFEEKLIALEQRLKARLFARRKASAPVRSKAALTKLQQKSTSSRRKDARKNAA